EPEGNAPGTSQIVSTGPPAASILLSFPSAKKARERPSGDQNGAAAPSVPGSAAADSSASNRTQRETLPSEPRATNAIRRPSGERANRFCIGTQPKRAPSGARISKRMGAAGGPGELREA